MKFFIGAKNAKTGQVEIAEIIEAPNFDIAYFTLRKKAAEEIGAGKYRVTAVNEYVDSRPSVAEFLAGADKR